jgi:O-methyltransferase
MNKYSEIVKKIINNFNFKIEHKNSWYKRNEHLIAEITDEELNIIKEISSFSMSTPANHWAIIQSLKHISENKIEGDVVESGVWKGGNLILFKIFLDKLQMDKKIFAYDTFSGMPLPGGKDFDLKNINAKKIYDNYENKGIKWCYSNLDEVKSNIMSFDKNYINSFNFIKGKVEDTLKIPNNLPEKICLLRLDTDFYESTKKELEVLFPKLVSGGVLIIDDYGHWKGSKQAVDEYFDLNKNFFWLHRIDYASRLLIKN